MRIDTSIRDGDRVMLEDDPKVQGTYKRQPTKNGVALVNIEWDDPNTIIVIGTKIIRCSGLRPPPKMVYTKEDV